MSTGAEARSGKRSAVRRSASPPPPSVPDEARLDYQATVLRRAFPDDDRFGDTFAALPVEAKSRMVERGRNRMHHERSLSMLTFGLCGGIVVADVAFERLLDMPKGGLVEHHRHFIEMYKPLLEDIDAQIAKKTKTAGIAAAVPPWVLLVGYLVLHTVVYLGCMLTNNTAHLGTLRAWLIGAPAAPPVQPAPQAPPAQAEFCRF